MARHLKMLNVSGRRPRGHRLEQLDSHGHVAGENTTSRNAIAYPKLEETDDSYQASRERCASRMLRLRSLGIGVGRATRTAIYARRGGRQNAMLRI